MLMLIPIAATGCRSTEQEGLPTATPDIALLETRTEAQLAARLTAIAPSPTASPLPTDVPDTPVPTVEPTETPTPLPTGFVPPFVLVRGQPNEAANIVVPEWAEPASVLTHFTEPLSFYSVRWSQDGSRLYFVSSHDFAYSRGNERNVFAMRPDGAELAMITGENLPPEDAQGPFVVVRGRVTGAAGSCKVTAQGMAGLVDADGITGQFVLEGVPEQAAWVRAICQGDSITYQGSLDLNLAAAPGPVEIPVSAGGSGWRDVSSSPDGQRFVGTYYEWSLDDNDEVIYQLQGSLYDLDTGEYAVLEFPEGMTFHGASWSPDGERIVGGLSDEEKAYLWLWDTQGVSLGELLQVENPEDQILTIVRPVWSQDGAWIAYELHRWYWWANERFRTDLVVASADGQTVNPLVETEWGWHTTHLSWGSGAERVFFQYFQSEVDMGGLMPARADVFSVDVESRETTRWTEDGASYLPAVHPSADGF